MTSDPLAQSCRRLINVVVPVLNEEECLPLFYEAVKAVTDDLSEYDWEFVFVDDGSTDRTSEILRTLRERDPRVSVLQLARNFGSHSALRAGIDFARGDAVITISADLQDSPELFRSFVAHWREGYHTVWGVRAQRDDPWSKTLLATLFYKTIGRMALPGFPPGGMDCGLFDRKVIEVLRQIPDRHNITFMSIFWMGFRQKYVPYRREARKLGTSKWPLGKRIRSALDVLTAFSAAPLRLASYCGVATAGLSFLAFPVVLLTRAFSGGDLGWSALILALFFLVGIQLIALGILGEYVWRMAQEVRGRPYYVLMDELEAPAYAREPVRLPVAGSTIHVLGGSSSAPTGS